MGYSILLHHAPPGPIFKILKMLLWQYGMPGDRSTVLYVMVFCLLMDRLVVIQRQLLVGRCCVVLVICLI